ncbi:PREDICTED: SWR1 complex subunit 2 isoform X1 [Camelina sativa]|uniref:SWR1 complex subunit 2 isoform X1 n=1 Tax=Camelina sativa TaxID=90675 RepID=A0ABM0ZK67_CAMSA|nr:PREDICTED: SWR1 complex subunit 2 isoform X1 [Camelina sativa]XP_010516901.1 PREDICTED: SWR1 complex subunit 2 isoform X1 [Camelina sativa]
MESDKEEPVVFLDRTTRATRGKRMTKLLDDEVEEDEQFWNQEALKEEEHDDEYEAEGEVADEFDSDFNDDEPEPEAVAENEKVERDLPKKRLIYPGKPASKKKKKKTKVISKLEDTPGDEKPGEEVGNKEQDEKDENEAQEDMEGEKVIRKSTRTSVVVRQAERDALRAAIQATTKPIQRKKVGEEKRMTQEEMLLEAAQTEIMNLRNLERVLAREEEVKKKAIVHKAVYKGPQIRYISKDGCNYLEFSNGASFNSELSTKSVPYPDKAVCVITGLPAKYRDPKTGLPYATKDAFKAIRERFMDEHDGLRKKMEMGDLFDTLVAKGFTRKQKRTKIPRLNKSFTLRNSARFLRFESEEESEEEEDSE